MKVGSWLCMSACLMGMASGQGSAFGQGTTEAVQSANVAGDGVVPAFVTKKVEPAVGGIPFSKRVNGDVIIEVSVAADGTVKDTKVKQGLPSLIGPAVHAVSQWQFEPARANGVAMASTSTVIVHFSFYSQAAGTALPPQATETVQEAAPRPSLPPPQAGMMRISGRMMATLLEKKVDPIYPQDSIAVDARGAVLLLATITKAGEVSDVQVVSGPERFRNAATTAVKQWHYKPYVVDDQPVDVQTTITLDFAPPAH